MKAFEARKESVEPQYDEALNQIKKAVDYGWSCTQIQSNGLLYPEIIERLAKEDGYDVKVVIKKESHMSYTEVSWSCAEKGKEGTINYINEKD